jgi:hypothetical protein
VSLARIGEKVPLKALRKTEEVTLTVEIREKAD